MKVYFSSDYSPEDATYANAVHNMLGKKLIKDAYWMFMPDGRHQ